MNMKFCPDSRNNKRKKNDVKLFCQLRHNDVISIFFKFTRSTAL